jgi:hypothetical protein
MNLQEIFDTATVGIIKQGGPASSKDTYMCAYRGEDGRKCAVGQLIPDELYTADLEGKGVHILGIPGLQEILPQVDVTDKVFSLLDDLQDTHDNAPTEETEDGVRYWTYQVVACLKELAKTHRLDASAMLEAAVEEQLV